MLHVVSGLALSSRSQHSLTVDLYRQAVHCTETRLRSAYEARLPGSITRSTPITSPDWNASGLRCPSSNLFGMASPRCE